MAEYKLAEQEQVLGDNPRITILNTTIDILDAKQTIALVETYVQKKVPLHLIGVNADKINEANRNERLKQIVNSCGVIHADGASVVLASRFLGKPLPERVAGIDLMQSLVALSEEKGYSIYLLGARQEVVEKTAAVLQKKHPALKIAGVHNGYFKEKDWPQISQELKEKKPDLIFVGITSPLKEYLVEYLQDDGNNGVFMGVGGSFDVISGKIHRAPVWMQKMNLEWLFRVMQEPKRLCKRYFVGNGKFIKAIVKERMAGGCGPYGRIRARRI
jgi:N-acetylglucosaminyldiphosphoundecaprenol N-acetyl-beta-D-mannosaminyltransferase